MRRDQRGLTSSVQFTVLFPMSFLVLLAVLQWSLHFWADATLAAANQGASAAAVLDGSSASGESQAAAVASNGSLSGVRVAVDRGANETVATVTGRAVTVLWPHAVTRSVRIPTERLS